MQIRDYQQAAIDAVIGRFRNEQNKSLLLVAATGLGKTVMMGEIARRVPSGRVMMVSHRLELNLQAISTFESLLNETPDLEQAEFEADQKAHRSRIVVASIQTLCSKKRGKYRMEKFDPNEFSLLMIDEAHHSASESYRRVIEYFQTHDDLKVLGVTATPDRSDGKPLGDIFEYVAADFSVLFAIENGWLVAPRDLYVPVKAFDWSAVKVSRARGDFTKQELVRLVNNNKSALTLAYPIYKESKGKPTIAFCATVHQAHSLAKALNDQHAVHGSSFQNDYAQAIDGSLPPSNPERRKILDDFKTGKTKILCNCSVLTEGFDHHLIGCLAMCRPTKSRSLYIQMLGRGLRTIAGTVDGLLTSEERLKAIRASTKPDCLILDFCMQSGYHRLMHTTDVLAKPEDNEQVRERAARIFQNSTFDSSAQKALDQARFEHERYEAQYKLRMTVKTQYYTQERTKGAVAPHTSFERRRCPNELRGKRPSDKQTKFMLKLGFTQQQIDQMNIKEVAASIQKAIRNPVNDFGRWMQKQQRKGRNG